jgi:hypothetical protein
MNHKFEKNNDTICWEWMTNWELVVILSNIRLSYDICYDRCEQHYYVFVYDNRPIMYKHDCSLEIVHKHAPEIIQYLVSNNICTIYNDDSNIRLVFNPHILLELC